MEKINTAVSKNYHIDENKKDIIIYLLIRSHESMRDSTIRFTGPVFIREVLKENKNISWLNLPRITAFDFFSKNSDIEIPITNNAVIKCIRDGRKTIAVPMRNTTYWLQSKEQKKWKRKK
ncbi:MAG: hypothetical protein LEGION0398_MBIBDBAK_01441 [Legionellaceae bacterium]